MIAIIFAGLRELIDNQSLLLQYSRDGYVIEGELKEYEDSCEKSSIKFKVKDFIQAIKESSCKRRSKLAFENADFEFESRVDTFKDKEIYPIYWLIQVQDQNGLHDEIDVSKKTHDDSSLQNNGTADQQVNTVRPEVNTGSREVSTTVPEVNIATPED
ncbi:hypothetical protein Tco_1034843 [Tanacetum coccineum]